VAHIPNAQCYEVAAAQFAIKTEVEKRELGSSCFQCKK
jgi:hypothetical protein